MKHLPSVLLPPSALPIWCGDGGGISVFIFPFLNMEWSKFLTNRYIYKLVGRQSTIIFMVAQYHFINSDWICHDGIPLMKIHGSKALCVDRWIDREIDRDS